MAHPGCSSVPPAAEGLPSVDQLGHSPWQWRPDPGSVLASPVSLLQLRGADSKRFLHGQTSQAIELARPGQWLSTCCITPTARMRAVAEVLVSDDGAWLVIREGDAALVRQALDRVLFPADAVVLGPLRAGELLEPLQDDDGDGPAEPMSGPGSPAPAAACWRPLAGGDGFWLGQALLLLEPEAAAADAGLLEPAAQALLQRPRLDREARERWRIQQGLPASPGELNDDTNPFELGLAERVSLSKGCYVGQETLARLATYDGVRQQLRRWFLPAAVAPEPGTALLHQGERAGRITSVLPLPEAAGWIGLALVRRSALDAPTLTLERDGSEPLTLQMSQPDQFVVPPSGPGGAARQPG